jgi:hypothetical protein
VLNKGICKLCILQKSGKQVFGNDVCRFRKWEKLDEVAWKNGVVYCRSLSSQDGVKINEAPPKWCLFETEHVVSQENK